MASGVDSIEGAVVVVTGASSGIGKATALEFARRGARVAVAARRAEALEDTVRACEELGGRAMAVPTDVRDASAVERLAERAAGEWGLVDVWVNAAAVSLFGAVDEAPLHDLHAALETDLFGYLHGMRTAIRSFRQQGHGVLINVNSIVSAIPQPFTGAYVAGKAGALQLAHSIQLETMRRREDIAVCNVIIPTIDTPLFQHAGNFSRRAPKALPPVYPAERVARAIVACAEHPRSEVYPIASARLWVAAASLTPGLARRLMGWHVDRNHFTDEAAPDTHGAVLEPIAEGTSVDGGWLPEDKRRRRMVGVGAAALGAVGGLALLRAAILR